MAHLAVHGDLEAHELLADLLRGGEQLLVLLPEGDLELVHLAGELHGGEGCAGRHGRAASEGRPPVFSLVEVVLPGRRWGLVTGLVRCLVW